MQRVVVLAVWTNPPTLPTTKNKTIPVKTTDLGHFHMLNDVAIDQIFPKCDHWTAVWKWTSTSLTIFDQVRGHHVHTNKRGHEQLPILTHLFKKNLKNNVKLSLSLTLLYTFPSVSAMPTEATPLGLWNFPHCVMRPILHCLDVRVVVREYFFNSQNKTFSVSFHNSYLSIIMILIGKLQSSFDLMSYFETSEEYA